jgi:hypothetical protein
MSVDPLAAIDVVPAYADTLDPAIDVAKSNLDAYKKTRNPKLLVFKEGVRPAKFKLQPIEASYLAERLDSLQLFEKLAHAFMVSCHEIELADGTKIRPDVLNDDPVHGVKVATRKWVNEVARRFRLATVYEMGSVAVQRAQLRPEELGPFDW